jgi:hypothetical protein
MKKVVLSVAVLAVVGFTSCEKGVTNPGNVCGFTQEVANEDASLRLANSGYSTDVTRQLVSSGEGHYTEGTIEYRIDGQVEAVVDFGDGTQNFVATKTENGQTSSIDLKQGKKYSKYKKVIVKPLVKTGDCDYIVEGIIKYFKGKKWVATIDYGDGTCDEWATKKTADDFTKFSLAKKK